MCADSSLEWNRERWVFLVQRVERRRANIPGEISVGLIRIVEQAEAAPQRGLVIAEDIVRESEPWVPVPHGGIGLECVGNVGIPGIRERIDHVVEIPVPLDRVGLKLVANTHVERESAGHFPIVFNVGRKGDVAKVAIAVGFPVPRARKDAGRAV